MTITTAAGTKYYVEFLYENVSFGIIDPPGRKTTCIIDEAEEPHRGIGATVCVPWDRFEKWKGRRLAFQRAVQDLLPDDRNKRKLLWHAYMLGRNKP